MHTIMCNRSLAKININIHQIHCQLYEQKVILYQQKTLPIMSTVRLSVVLTVFVFNITHTKYKYSEQKVHKTIKCTGITYHKHTSISVAAYPQKSAAPDHKISQLGMYIANCLLCESQHLYVTRGLP